MCYRFHFIMFKVVISKKCRAHRVTFFHPAAYLTNPNRLRLANEQHSAFDKSVQRAFMRSRKMIILAYLFAMDIIYIYRYPMISMGQYGIVWHQQKHKQNKQPHTHRTGHRSTLPGFKPSRRKLLSISWTAFKA